MNSFWPSRTRSPRGRGFTLIELLVVMLVIVILAGVVFKAGRALQERSKVQQAKADVARLAMALERYYADHGHYPPGGNTSQANVGLSAVDFQSAIGYSEVGNGHGGASLWAYLDEDCTYRRDRRAYIQGWPKDRLGAIVLGGSSNLLCYYKDPWGNPYRYITINGNLEERNCYFVASAGPNGMAGNNNVDADDIWTGYAGTNPLYEGGGEKLGR